MVSQPYKTIGFVNATFFFHGDGSNRTLATMDSPFQ
jgi:hypothetical protein